MPFAAKIMTGFVNISFVHLLFSPPGLPSFLPLSYFFTGAAESLSVSLKIDKVPVMGENICLTVIVTNRANVCRVLKEHVNAQAEEYHGRPMETFWEATERLQVGPCRGKYWFTISSTILCIQ